MSDSTCWNCGAVVLPFAELCLSCGSENPGDEFLGRTIRGNIRIESLIGSGGMGNVYKGVETHLDRPVAVKVLNHLGLTDDSSVARFLREAKLLSRLRHPSIVSVLDFGRDEEGTLFLVLEYIPGRPLDDVLESEGPFEVGRAGKIVSHILSALEEAHSKGVVHRDLKPGNILLENVRGNQDFVKVLDFGIAKMLTHGDGGSTTGRGALTEMGTMVGTPHYMSPEQAQGLPLDHRSDIYSMGIVLYELLTGEVPFDDEKLVQVLVRRLTEDPPPPSTLKSDIPSTMDAIVLRAMARDPGQRFANVEEMRVALENLGSQPMAALSPAPAAPLPERPPTTVVSASEVRQSSGTAVTVLGVRALIVKNAATGQGTEAKRATAVWKNITDLIQARGGKVDNPPGQLALALFEGTSTGVVAAAKAAIELRDKVVRRYPFTRLQLGIGTGTLHREGGKVTGDALDACLRRTREAVANQILVGSEVEHIIKPAFELRAVGADLEIVNVLAGLTFGGEATLQKETSTADTVAASIGLVGRRSHRDLIETTLDTISTGRPGRALLLAGEHGMGKSLLCRFARRLAEHRGIPVLEAYAAEELIDRPFRPLLDLAIQAAGITLEGPGNLVDAAALTHGLHLLGLSERDAATLVEQFISGTSEDPWTLFSTSSNALPYAKLCRSIHVFPPKDRRHMLAGAMRRLIQLLTAAGGCVLIVEDLERADPCTVSCIDLMTQAAKDLPVLILCTSAENNLLGTENLENVTVGPVPTSELAGFVENMQNSHGEQGTQITREVLAASKGSPLYLARYLEAPVEGAPTTPVELVATQIAHLPGRLRRLLLIASVAGEYFEESLLAGLFPKANNLSSALEGAAVAGLLEQLPRMPGVWRFSNRTIHNAVYRSLSRADRAKFHANIYQGLTKRDDISRRRDLLRTLHAQRAQLGLEAMDESQRLADRFAIAGDTATAAHWYEESVEAARRSMQSGRSMDLGGLTETCLKGAETALRAGEEEAADSFLTKARPHDAGQQLRVAIGRARVALALSDYTGAAEVLDRAVGMVAPQEPVLAGVFLLRAETLVHAGANREALEVLTRALQLLSIGEPSDDLIHFRSLGLVLYGDIAARLGGYEQAEEAILNGLNRARADRDETTIVRAARSLHHLLAGQRRDAVTKTFLEDVIRDPQVAFRPTHLVQLYEMLGQVYDRVGDSVNARSAREFALTQAREYGISEAVQNLERSSVGQTISGPSLNTFSARDDKF